MSRSTTPSVLSLLALLSLLAVSGCSPQPPPPVGPPGNSTPGVGRSAVRPGREPRHGRDGRPEVAAPDTPAQARLETTMPARYVGPWAANERDCADPAAESRLQIGPRELRFHESHGAVLRVEQTGAHLTVALRITGEGEARDARYVLTLSPEGNTLVDVDTGFARRRCGASRSPVDGAASPQSSSSSPASMSSTGATSHASAGSSSV